MVIRQFVHREGVRVSPRTHRSDMTFGSADLQYFTLPLGSANSDLWHNKEVTRTDPSALKSLMFVTIPSELILKYIPMKFVSYKDIS